MWPTASIMNHGVQNTPGSRSERFIGTVLEASKASFASESARRAVAEEEEPGSARFLRTATAASLATFEAESARRAVKITNRSVEIINRSVQRINRSSANLHQKSSSGPSEHVACRFTRDGCSSVLKNKACEAKHASKHCHFCHSEWGEKKDKQRKRKRKNGVSSSAGKPDSAQAGGRRAARRAAGDPPGAAATSWSH